MDVAIVGLGMHPFGRTPSMSGLEQGAAAARAALADAGTDFKRMQFAFGGSQDSGNADSLVNLLGLTGLQFTNVANGCATGGSSLNAAYSAIKSGQYDVGLVVGFDKHDRGAFNPKPADWGLDDWYGETGLMLTTQYFGMKIQRYMHDHGISKETLIRVAEKAFRNGSLTPTAWRQTAPATAARPAWSWSSACHRTRRTRRHRRWRSAAPAFPRRRAALPTRRSAHA